MKHKGDKSRDDGTLEGSGGVSGGLYFYSGKVREIGAPPAPESGEQFIWNLVPVFLCVG